ncbi:FAD-dependent oxidoreductase [Ruficoccus amylovorans]|uniref:FAD-dependent oxidoreductase n=1 Tax=Ruficoccus amylovorans TaxID=1804625 RepID=A0A842HB69_9BACT|nr:FAD-dependent oxidoreductase [Ruficoccus amylovorans]MBC2592877.1 FAD-dependent oxidoreductase [Ruficoccus amylovorans]
METCSTLLRYYHTPNHRHALTLDVDICIFGGNSGGIIAAIAAKRKGLSVALLEPGYHLGGLTAGGLGYTDIGNKFAIGGLAREFYRRIGLKYNQPELWRFEPSAAEAVYREWLDEQGIECYLESFLESVETAGGKIVSLSTENGIKVKARQFIDATYEGDLMAQSGVSYTVGRESNSVYGETWNGQQLLRKHQFEYDVDPYRIKGRPSSGLLPGINEGSYEQGAGDRCVQAYNFRLCMTNDPARRIPFSEPEHYNRDDYELCARYCRAGHIPSLRKFDALINSIYDVNNWGAISTDYVGMNHDFPDADYATREKIFQSHVQWTKGLLWFWSTDPSVDENFRRQLREFGWPEDQFPETENFSHSLYVREARRMVSDLVMNEHHCTGRLRVEDPVGLAAYTMDSHNCRRIVIDGKVLNEGDVQIHSGPPYPISYRSIIPSRGEISNLLVPFCLSASHIAFGSIRMEPVFMILSESAVEAASLAIEHKFDLQDIPYERLKKRLLDAQQVIHPVPKVKNTQTGE